MARELVLGSLLLAALPTALAAPDQRQLPPVVVTATRTSIPVDQVLAPVVIIDRDEIERSLAMDIAELLRFHGGLEVARNGGPGQVTSVFIRGAESDHTLVMIDGVRVNAGTSALAAVQNISPDVVDRIEIVKGPRSALYGSEAIGGVVNIITRADKAPMTVRGEAGGGKYDTRRGAGEFSLSGDPGALGLNVSWLDTGGFPTFEASDDDAGYDNLTFDGWTEFALGPADVRARHWQSSGNTEYSDFFLAPVDQDYTNKVSELLMTMRPAGSWQSRLSVSRVVDDIEQGETVFNPKDFTKTDRYAADWQNTVALGHGMELVAGVFGSDEKTSGVIFGERLEATPGDGDVDIDVYAGYLQASGSIGAHRFVAAGRYTDHDIFGGEYSWNADYGYDLTSDLRVTVGAGRAYRAPTSLELYGFGGNPDLNPEVSRNVDFALSWHIDPRQEVSVGGFRNKIDDLIDFFFTDPDLFVGENRNIEDAEIRGLELAYQFRGQKWRLRGEITLQDPDNETDDERLLRRAKQILTLSAGRRFGPHEIGLDVLATDDRRDFGGANLAGYVLANLTARLQLARDLVLKARVENLLDRDYELAEGYRSAERGLYATLSYTY